MVTAGDLAAKEQGQWDADYENYKKCDAGALHLTPSGAMFSCKSSNTSSAVTALENRCLLMRLATVV